jgi:hypothetical protein
MRKILPKEKIYSKIDLSEKLAVNGVTFDGAIFEDLDFEKTYRKQQFAMYDFNHANIGVMKIPEEFTDPDGYLFRISYDPESNYSITREDGLFYLNFHSKPLFGISFSERPKFYRKKTSDGVPMEKVANAGRSQLTIVYSNECDLFDKGLDCLFCNINPTKRRHAEREGLLFWKTPQQIAESVKAAYDEGYRHFTLTGGFVPERREVDYYIDVAAAVRKELGRDDIGASASVGVPSDFDTVGKYKESGFITIAHNMEIWDENIYKTICPGKDQYCGGRQHWLEILEYEVEVFGRGNVRSCFVTGIEPKSRTLEGFEYLIERGVVAVPNLFSPRAGSALEGLRSPSSEWYHDMVMKTYALYRKHGITHRNYYESLNGGEDTVFDWMFDADDDILPWEKDFFYLETEERTA